jgi:hypothetical protein
MQNVPSLFVWNVDDTGVRISKKHVAPDVAVAKQTPQELLQSLKNATIVKSRDEPPSHPLETESSQSSSAKPNFRNRKIDWTTPISRPRFRDDECGANVDNLSFVDWLATSAVYPKSDQLHIITHFGGPIVFLVEVCQSCYTGRHCLCMFPTNNSYNAYRARGTFVPHPPTFGPPCLFRVALNWYR